MRKWKYTLRLNDLWDAREEKRISIFELSTKVAERIKKKSFFEAFKDELEEIVERFESLGTDEGFLTEIEAIGEFDFILEELYDWADSESCWVATRA